MPKNTKKALNFSKDALSSRLKDAGLNASPSQREALFIYLELLQKWNKVMNLVGPYSWEKMLDELIVDSFYLADFIKTLPLPAEPKCWDFGAGAGLPGIPLRVLWQEGHYTMVDSREKRVVFLQNVLARLALPQTNAVCARVENFMEGTAAADLLLSRAFMPWEKLLELVTGRLAKGGVCVFMTLEEAPENLPAGLESSWKFIKKAHYDAPDGKRHLWAFTSI